MDNINKKTLGRAVGVVDIIHATDMYEAYPTCDDDEQFDNHGIDDTDADTNNDTGDGTDDDLCSSIIGISLENS